MKFQTKVFYLMGEMKCRMREAVEALKLRDENREWAEEFISRRHLEGLYPEWIVYPKWTHRRLEWCRDDGAIDESEASTSQD